jgi:hypothetical protein
VIARDFGASSIGTCAGGSTVEETANRWVLIRDVVVFQAKLAVDALRDLVLSPLTLAAAVVDLVRGREVGGLFHELLVWGRRSERWIDLFGDAGRGEARAGTSRPGPGLDDLIGRLERLIVEQYERGGLTASAKTAIDRSLDAINRQRDPR